MLNIAKVAGTRAGRVAFAVIATVLVLFLIGVASGQDPPMAGIVALDTTPALAHDLEYAGPLTDGARYVITVRGDEDPWNVNIQFKGGPNGVEDPRLGATNVVGELLNGQEGGKHPMIGLVMGDNDLEARTTRGSFFAKLTYEEGRVPHVDSITIAPDGIRVKAMDPNEAAGDRVVQYEFTIQTADGTIVYGPQKHQTSTLGHMPSKAGAYLVLVRAQDLRGAWSVTISKEFTIIGTLSQQDGFSGGLTEGASSIAAPAIDQKGNPIFDAIKPGGGSFALVKRSVFGWTRIIFCPIQCQDPFNDGVLRWIPGLRDFLVEVIS